MKTWQILMVHLLTHILLFLTSSSSQPTNNQSSNYGVDLPVLLSFRSFITSDPKHALSSWSLDTAGNGTSRAPLPDYCEWTGVACSNGRHPGHVTAIRLQGLGLAGTICRQLGNLTRLRVLSLSANNLQGEIPGGLSGCTALHAMDLSDNFLYGSMPASLGLLSKLTSLNVSHNSLTGDIPMSFSNLTALANLNMSSNHFHGQIPSWLGNLTRLRVLSLSANYLQSEIPDSISGCTSLHALDLSENHLYGSMPASLGLLPKLKSLNVTHNNLTGDIPMSFSNLTALTNLSMNNNHFNGQIPSWFGNLTSLTHFELGQNNFSGHISPALSKMANLVTFYIMYNNLEGPFPPSMFNISSITNFNIGFNNLTGSLPLDVGFKLPKLQNFATHANQFVGPIPASLSNVSTLENLFLRGNQYHGLIPRDIGTHGHLRVFSLGDNLLQTTEPRDWDFLTSLTNCSNLGILDLEQNNLEGVMPVTIIANLSTELIWITLGRNKISGTIPAGLGKFQKLTKFLLSDSLFTGTLPLDIGQIPTLQYLDLSHNRFYGQIPQSLGNITQLSSLPLSNNFLGGSIPSSLGNLTKIISLDLSGNSLRGEIPKEILSIPSLTVLLNLSNNALSGPIPTQIGKLNSIGQIDLSNNKLSGEIPDSLSSCVQLNSLNLKGNLFHGKIPKGFSNLKGLEMLDLSNNNLAGPIPEFLQSFELLTYLNLSFNNLSGPVPNTGIFRNATVLLLPGNRMLCGGPPSLQLPSCPYIGSNQVLEHRRLVILFCMVGTLIFFMFSLTACYLMKTRIKRNIAGEETCYHHGRISYAEIDAATESFSPANLIGSGSFGNVYVGTLYLDENLCTVAIKVLNLGKRGANRSFLRECEALRMIRHRKLVKVITVCSSLDHNGDDFKALVLEFVCNGNLDEWLHPNEMTNNTTFRRLSLMERLCIALDVAEALEYLHHQIEPSIVHCDIKPCNILLDDDIVAHVTDFGLAKIMHTDECMHSGGGTESSSLVIKGTIGYVAPEYGSGSEPSTDGDIYSYGVLLLEIFTGRRPTDSFMDGVTSLINYVRMACPDKLLEILDASATYSGDTQRIIDIFLYPMFKLGLACCEDSPRHRMKMDDVVKELNTIKKAWAAHMDVHTFRATA